MTYCFSFMFVFYKALEIVEWGEYSLSLKIFRSIHVYWEPFMYQKLCYVLGEQNAHIIVSPLKSLLTVNLKAKQEMPWYIDIYVLWCWYWNQLGRQGQSCRRGYWTESGKMCWISPGIADGKLGRIKYNLLEIHAIQD